jgi:hypothetical protein
MPLTKVKDLIDRASVTLQDSTNVRWSRVELLGYLNDAQLQIALHRPDASSQTVAFACANASRQQLPANGMRLLTIVRNTTGRAITQISRETLDIQMPNWHVEPASEGVENYVYDPLDPKTFYVFPVPAAAHSIDLIQSIAPVIIAAETPTVVIGLDDIYANVVADYMLFRAYQKDATYGDLQKANLYLQAFNSALGIKTQVDSALASRRQQGTAQ